MAVSFQQLSRFILKNQSFLYSVRHLVQKPSGLATIESTLAVQKAANLLMRFFLKNKYPEQPNPAASEKPYRWRRFKRLI